MEETSSIYDKWGKTEKSTKKILEEVLVSRETINK